MDTKHLIMMANDIGSYFAGYPSHDEAVAAIANHLQNFWEARMRRDIVRYVISGGTELKPMVRQAVIAMNEASRATTEDVGEG